MTFFLRYGHFLPTARLSQGHKMRVVDIIYEETRKREISGTVNDNINREKEIY